MRPPAASIAQLPLSRLHAELPRTLEYTTLCRNAAYNYDTFIGARFAHDVLLKLEDGTPQTIPAAPSRRPQRSEQPSAPPSPGPHPQRAARSAGRTQRPAPPRSPSSGAGRPRPALRSEPGSPEVVAAAGLWRARAGRACLLRCCSFSSFPCRQRPPRCACCSAPRRPSRARSR